MNKKSEKGFQTVLKMFKTMEEKEKVPNCKKVPEKTNLSVQKLQECASVSNVPTSDVILPAKCLKSFPAKNIYFKKQIGTPKGVKNKKNMAKCKNAKTDTKFEDIRNFFEPKSAKISSLLSQTSECTAQASYTSTIVPETSPEPQHLHKPRETERIKEIRSPSFKKKTSANAIWEIGQWNSLNS